MSIVGIYILVLINADVHRVFRNKTVDATLIFVRHTQWGHIGVPGKADDLI